VPFELLYGQKPLEFKDLSLPSPTTSVESVTDFVSRMESLVADASKSIAQANQTAERNSNRKRMGHVFGVGDKMLLSTKHFTPPAYQGRKWKLAGKFAGPYEVVQVVSPVAVKLLLPFGTKARPVFHTTGERTPPPPEPVILDGFEEYEVEQIIAQRRSRNQTQYLVKRKNYPVSDASWEPRSNLEGNEALIAFQKAREGT
jgi:Chromo (CHRromatin Organisation MOdifier) domain